MTSSWFVFILILSVITKAIPQSEVRRNSKKRTNMYDQMWKQEYEDELTDALMTTKKRNNVTLVHENSAQENEKVLEKLMETITASEKYLKKIDSIDFKINRLDIEVHEKTNNILTYLVDMMKVIRTLDPKGIESVLEEIKAEISKLKMDSNRRINENGKIIKLIETFSIKN